MQPDTWQLDAELQSGPFRRCTNCDTPAVCHWLLSESDTGMHCMACSLNRTIPDLSITENYDHWRKVEIAKRRLVAQLVSLGLQLVLKSVDEVCGLAFDFVGIDLEGKSPTTG